MSSKSVLDLLSRHSSDSAVVASLGALLLGAAPLSWPLVAILGGAAALGLGSRGLRAWQNRRSRIRARKNRNPTITLGAWWLLCVPALLFLPLASGCAGAHPLLNAQSLNAALETAAGALNNECAHMGIYPGYELEIGGSDADPDFVHGFGGIVGGCDDYAKISCMVRDCPSGALKGCEPQVDCAIIRRLTAAASQATSAP